MPHSPLFGVRTKLSVTLVPNAIGKPAARQPRKASGSTGTLHQSTTLIAAASRSTGSGGCTAKRSCW